MEKGKKPERVLNREALVKNGINYYDDVFRNQDIVAYLHLYYPQASIVTEGLLECKHILSQSSFEKLSADSQNEIRENYHSSMIPQLDKRSSIDLDHYNETYQIALHDARFELARRIQRSANNIRSGKEHRWSALVKNELFGTLIESSRRAEGATTFDPRKIVQEVKMYVFCHPLNYCSIDSCLSAKMKTPGSGALKPDLYMALPITRNSKAVGFRKDDYIQNFTETYLANLEEHKNGNLISSPITRLDKDLREKDRVCFPCAVVEIKHHKVSQGQRRKCYCQAANGAATALSMLGRLSYLSAPNNSYKEVQPVVSFTFIGYEARVWIACIVTKIKEETQLLCEYEMHCIWEGDLRKIWDTVRLCRIIENLHYWTVTHYRVWVSSCLSRWRCELSAIAERSILGQLEDLGVTRPKTEDDDWESENDAVDSTEESDRESGQGAENQDDDKESDDLYRSEGEREWTPRPKRSSKVGRPRMNGSKSLNSTPQKRRDVGTLLPAIKLDHGKSDSLLQVVITSKHGRSKSFS
ncbi:uncharacterized protein PAC_04105 [Phialocephala subalpina]|uniref:Uncharacterized protein n=1 Tax=Phialocephala subalpina TaxID=576137 RepID=A0A1L7WN86_9HELO|nr:uncharacterized protein PAC_04105 [Phialocephala subalpina]